MNLIKMLLGSKIFFWNKSGPPNKVSFQSKLDPPSNIPIAGQDAQWLGYCINCGYQELHASRGGFRNGSIMHCYGCGNESEMKGFGKEQTERMILHSRMHWQKYHATPYNWHLLAETDKLKIVRN